MPSGRTNNFPLKWAWPRSRDPLQFLAVRSAVLAAAWLLVFTSQEIGCENRVQNDLDCVEWDVKPYSTANENIIDDIPYSSQPSCLYTMQLVTFRCAFRMM